MPVQNFFIRCYAKGCPHEASHKIASRWSDGITSELKTYSLCCAGCLPDVFRESCMRQATCRLAAGETLETPGIYHLRRGSRDRDLKRLLDIEAELQAAMTLS